MTAEGSPRAIAEQLLASIDRTSWQMTGTETAFAITLAATNIAFDAKSVEPGRAFERLAFAVEARIAFERASAMLAAVPSKGPLPLWLVSGSDVLAHWLAWSGSSRALARVLTLDDALGHAPFSADLTRRARRELKQGGARIRVRQGIAVAQEIELAEQPHTTAFLGETALIQIDAATLPETLLAALEPKPLANAHRPLGEVIDHPFVRAADLRYSAVRNEGGAIVFDVASHQTPLAPVPREAWSVLPFDADPVFPWRPTAREIRAHDRLVRAGRRSTERLGFGTAERSA